MTRPVNPPTKYPYFYLPDGWDSAWKAAKASAPTTPCWITMFGDSIFNGHANASSYLKTVPELLIAQILAATGSPRYADYWSTVCGPPYLGPADHPWGAMQNGASPSHWEAGFHKAQYTSYVAGGIFQRFTAPYACTAMDIIYVDWQAGVSGWSYSIDGGAAVLISNTGGGTPATTTVKKISISGLANTTHTIDFLQTSSATAMILGVSTYAGTKGIGMARMNCDGAASTEMTAATNYPADRCRLHMGVVPQSDAGTGKTFGFPHGPSLLILGLLANNATAGEPGTDLEQMYNRLISAVRSLSPNCSVLLHIPSYPYSVTSDCSTTYLNQEAVRIYENEIYNVARYHGCAVLNTNWRWGQTPFGSGFLPNTDLHPKDAGHADMAATMATVL